MNADYLTKYYSPVATISRLGQQTTKY